jgi:hypothetical protein
MMKKTLSVLSATQTPLAGVGGVHRMVSANSAKSSNGKSGTGTSGGGKGGRGGGIK